jgi:integrase
MARKRTTGRRKGSRTRGYWFRSGRGWYVTSHDGKAVALCASGQHIKDKQATEAAEAAYVAYLKHLEQQAARMATGASTPLMEVCRSYLDDLKRHGNPATYDLRADYLFNFATGFGAKFAPHRKPKSKPTAADRIHAGLGNKAVGDLIPLDVQRWLDANKDWKGARRLGIQSIKRALNWAVKAGLIERNPIKGFSAGTPGKRAAYWTDEMVQLIKAHSHPPFHKFIDALLATGARPFSELAALTAANVEESGDGQRWVFTKHKTAKQTGRPRIVYVPEETAEVVRRLKQGAPTGPLFRNRDGKPWTPPAVRSVFYRLQKLLRETGQQFPADAACAYAARHTFARRSLGKGITLEILAGLLGSSRDTVWRHYAAWVPAYTSPLWDAIRR